MAKTDDIIKKELSDIGDYKNLKRRGFLGSSNHDQELWTNGGLTFSLNQQAFGSNDFAWYKEEPWIDPDTKITCNAKPIIVIEGTHCLNTKSYGTAQIQRFHHAYGPFKNGIISIYYLRKGKYKIRHDLLKAVYNANILAKYRENKTCYLVTEEINDIKTLVNLIGDFGEHSDQAWDFIDTVINKMNDEFLSFYHHFSSYEDYLNSRSIYKIFKDNSKYESWIKFLGPKKTSFTDPSIRYGHIVLGEAFVAKYLIAGLSPNDDIRKLLYYFPLINSHELADLSKILIRDKEWIILSKSNEWILKSYDEIVFDDPNIKKNIVPFKNQDLNKNRKQWNIVRKEISAALKTNKFSFAE